MNDATRPELEIDEPCPKAWGELEGGGAKRFCAQCSLHVVDGSALTREAAADLVRTSEERVCMRLEVDADGRPVHADDIHGDGAAAEAHRERARRRLLAWGLSAAAGVLSACDDARRPGEPTDAATTGEASTDRPDAPEPPPELLGFVCYPEVLGEVDAPEPPPATEPEALELLGRVSIDRPSVPGEGVREELGKARASEPPGN